jgi:hypothetical protein
MRAVGPRDAPVVTVPAYLAAVRSIHGIGSGEVARALRVSPSLVRRWMRGALVPSFRRLKSMTTLWGGDAELLALGAALQRYSRMTGVGLDEATRMIRTGRRTAPARRAPVRAADRRQLALPMGS